MSKVYCAKRLVAFGAPNNVEQLAMLQDRRRGAIMTAREAEASAHRRWWVVEKLRESLDSQQAEYHAVGDNEIENNPLAQDLACTVNNAADDLDAAAYALSELADELWAEYEKARSAFLQAC